MRSANETNIKKRINNFEYYYLTTSNYTPHYHDPSTFEVEFCVGKLSRLKGSQERIGFQCKH